MTFDPRANPLRLSLILAVLTAFGPFATDMYLSGFSDIAASFAADAGQVQLGLSLYFAGSALGQLIYGPVTDAWGRKKPLIVGVLVFTLTSVAIAFAPTIESFAFLRLLQALGGCAGMVIARAVIGDLFDQRESARVLSLMMMVQGLAPVMAPILGGYLIVWRGWESVFLFLAGFGCLCLLIAWKGLPETLPPNLRRRASPLAILYSFYVLATDRRFIAPTLCGAFAFGGLFAFISGSPFIYMELFGVEKTTYGWLFALNAATMILAGFVNRALLKRFSPAQIALAALLAQLPLALLLQYLAGLHALVPLVAGLAACLCFMPMIGANCVAMAMAAASERRGGASALIGVIQFGAAALSSGIVGLLHNGAVWPVSLVILACALLSLVMFLAGRKGLKQP